MSNEPTYQSNCHRDDHELYREVLAARRAAHAKHGDNSIEVEPANSPRWLPILVEEIGEVANTLTYDGDRTQTRHELIDVIAVAAAWVDRLDRDGESQ